MDGNLQTRQEFWAEVAESYLTPRGKRTDKQEMLTMSGLCLASASFGGKCLDPDIESMYPRRSGDFWFRRRTSYDGWCNSRTRYADKIRGMCASLLSHISDTDAKELVSHVD